MGNEDYHMTSPAVVILTDPARCQLGDADVLLKALLQVQQLGSAGVPASQAFCDHPAAAREFVDAYSKAYPELQQQSSDLPLPEHLYSMVADGRFGPLPATNAGDPSKPGESAQSYPLYVLSLGAPESLMQAIQHNSLANSSIRVLEIAPIEHSRTESVTVAEAVAQEPAARSSWQAESPNASLKDDEEALSPEALAGDPFKLESVEIDLNQVQLDRHEAKTSSAQPAPAPGPEPAIIQILPNGGGVEAGAIRTGHANEVVLAGNRGDASPDVQPAPASVAALAPASEASSTSATESAVVTGPSLEPREPVPNAPPVPPVDEGQSTGDVASPPDGSVGEQISSQPPDDGLSDEIPAADISDIENSPPSGALSAEEPIAAASLGAEDGPVALHPSSFAEPGEDVAYPPSGNFAWDDNLSYPIPAELMPDTASFEDIFGSPASADVVDLEALCSDLRASIDASIQVEKFDLSLLRALQSGGPDSSDFPASPTMLHDAVPRYREMPDPDQDEAPDQILTTVHDTDL